MGNRRIALMVAVAVCLPFGLNGCGEIPFPTGESVSTAAPVVEVEEAAVPSGLPRGPIVGTYRLAGRNVDSDWTPPAAHWAILYGVAVGIVGLTGDLCESLIKRDVERKDSAALLPGFGGLLDLLDSVLYAGPVAYVLWLVLPLRTW